MSYQAFVVPRAGVEPARVAPLVFETSASTDSAIWAAMLSLQEAQSGAKVRVYFEWTKFSQQKST